MNSTDSTTVEPILPTDALKALANARRWTAIAVLTGALALIGAVVTVVVTVVTSDNQSRANGRALDDLTAEGVILAQEVERLGSELAEARMAIEATQKDDLARELCVRRLANNVNRASYTQEGAVADLVIVLAGTVPGSDRAAAAASAVRRIETARVSYNTALMLEAGYTPEVPAEPCPLDVPPAG